MKTKPIPGHPGYWATWDGRIFSSKGGEMRQMKTKIARTGYEQVALSLGEKGRYRHALVHQLVLEAYVGPCPKGYTCNHKDGKRANNSLQNLEWVTRGENERHARRELGKDMQGEKHPSAKLTADDVVEIRRLRALGVTYPKLVERFGVSLAQLHRIVKGSKWGHIA